MTPDLIPQWLSQLRWNDQGLLPAIVQSIDTHQVIMFAWMNQDALMATVETGYAVYWSRSRQSLWKKGERSGNLQKIRDIRLDCDEDALLLIVEQQGGLACHTGRERCFYRQLSHLKDTSSRDDGAALSWNETDPVRKDPKLIYGDSTP